MCDGYDGSALYAELQKGLAEGSSLLELGSGPGFDLLFLVEHYRVTGSDLSDEFLARLNDKYPQVTFLKLDAVSIETDVCFDGIFSNKVLHHLTRDELKQSLQAQAGRLAENGVIAHSFWLGDEDQEMHGLLFSYYRQQELLDILSERFDIVSSLVYGEIEESDSIFIIARLK